MRRLAIVTAWLLVGQAVWLTIFWGLLHVPESSVWMLALSAVLALAAGRVRRRRAGRRLSGLGSDPPAGGGTAGRRASRAGGDRCRCCCSARSGGRRA